MIWHTDSLWFEVAVVSIIYAVGNIAFGHFEEQTPKWRRLAKYIFTLVVVCTVSVYIGRSTAMLLLALFFSPFIYTHAYYLPKKKGINGFTGEPKDKYYDFRGWDKNIFKDP